MGDFFTLALLTAILRMTTPLLFTALGGLLSERSGVMNIGLEGMMILGTWGGAFIGYHYGPWAGILGAILLGMVGGTIHALATVVFGVDQQQYAVEVPGDNCGVRDRQHRGTVDQSPVLGYTVGVDDA